MRHCSLAEGHSQGQKNRIQKSHPERATIVLAPLTGKRRNAKSRLGSHISVRVLGRYPPTECVNVFVICIDFRFKLDLDTLQFRKANKFSQRTYPTPPLFFFSIKASYPTSKPPAVLSMDSGGLDKPVSVLPVPGEGSLLPNLKM